MWAKKEREENGLLYEDKYAALLLFCNGKGTRKRRKLIILASASGVRFVSSLLTRTFASNGDLHADPRDPPAGSSGDEEMIAGFPNHEPPSPLPAIFFEVR